MLELDCQLDFAAARPAEFFPVLPRKPAVCLIELQEAGAEAYLIRTQDLQRRLQRLLGPADPAARRLNLNALARRVRYRLTGSAFEQSVTYYRHARELFPLRYRKLMKLRPAAVLKVNLRNAYPRCYVTRRITVDADGLPAGGIYYGPFASRKLAEGFAEGALDLFKVRRCQIKIRRDPTFPGCIYSEMKMCLAPCFAGCSEDEYHAEVGRLVQFLETGGASLRSMIENEREQASEQLDFERAATLHKRLEKLDEALRGQPELARRIQDLNAVILQKAATENTLGIFAVRGGRLQEPYFLSFAALASQPQSAEQLFRSYLEDTSPDPGRSAATPGRDLGREELAEHLWLLSRWYYSNPREGEIFFQGKGWPYRRILRGCARLLALENTVPEPGS